MSEVLRFELREPKQPESPLLRVIEELEEMIWQDTDAICQLDDYVYDHELAPDDRVMKLLIERHLLNADGTIPPDTKEAIIYLRCEQQCLQG